MRPDKFHARSRDNMAGVDPFCVFLFRLMVDPLVQLLYFQFLPRQVAFFFLDDPSTGLDRLRDAMIRIRILG